MSDSDSEDDRDSLDGIQSDWIQEEEEDESCLFGEMEDCPGPGLLYNILFI